MTILPRIGTAMDKAFSDILKELRTQYLLGFYPKDVPLSKNKFHQLTIGVRDADLRVSARNGYYGEAESGSGPAGKKVSVVPRDDKD